MARWFFQYRRLLDEPRAQASGATVECATGAQSRRASAPLACARGSCLALVAIFFLTGCNTSTYSRTYPNHSADEVWQAMLIAAETPDYEDMDPNFRWSVIRNETWISPDEARLEIYRELQRTIIKPMREPRTENRTWRVKLAIAAEEPLRVYVASNNWSIPMHLMEEADRYFQTMEAFLTSPEQRIRLMTADDFVDDSAAGDMADDAANDLPPVDLIDD